MFSGITASFSNRLSDWCQSRIRSQSGYELLRQLFAYDPDSRLTAKEALRHKWFHEEPLPTHKYALLRCL
jgi:cyclin-dependent kinase 8/11